MWNSRSASVVDIALLRERQVSLSARVTLQNAFLDEPERSTNATFEKDTRVLGVGGFQRFQQGGFGIRRAPQTEETGESSKLEDS